MITKNLFIYVCIPIINFYFINIPIRLIIDWISCIFLRTVLIISRIILIFRIYYIPKKEHKKFNLILIIFVLSIIILINRTNIFLLILGWDILGISSYILVIYYQNNSSSGRGSITLLRNRIGDIFILISIGLMIFYSLWEFNINEYFSILLLIFLLIASCTKRAQFPFSAWLPIAISAPTPISALVHSSTLVTAGIYLIIRIINNFHPNIIFVIIILSSLTALYAGIAANWEQDIKKIIALSTLRQIAIIIFIISLTSIFVAYFHIIIHAFFKSLIFMCAGIIIHESSYQDIRIIRINNFNLPLISTIIGITNAALIGLPFTSGFFSKDIIIEKIISSKIECLLRLLIISSIGITASYSIRIILISNKNLIKCKPDINNHSNTYCNIPILLISPIAITLGTLLLWIIQPEQLLFLPEKFKNLILITLILGTIIGIMISFKNKKYIFLGLYAISLWSIHFLSTKFSLLTYPLINLYFKNDKNWQETYGPKKSFNLIKKLSKIPESKNFTIITTLLISLLIPIIFI